MRREMHTAIHNARVLPFGGITTPARGASLLEFAIVLPVLLIIISGVVDYGLALGRIEVISSAAREGARTAAAYSLEDDAGVPQFPERTCPGASRPDPALDSIYCDRNVFWGTTCDSTPDGNSGKNSLECLAINTALGYLTKAKFNPNDWEVTADTCIGTEPALSAGSPIPSSGVFNAVRVEIKRRPGFKNCLICYLGNLGFDIETGSAFYRLEGTC